MASPRISFKRLAVEGTVIFLGVFAGFLADDYRDYLNDRRRENQVLTQVLEDLAIDIDDIGPLVSNGRRREEAMGWLNSRARPPYPPADSVSSVINRLRSSIFITYEPSAFTYSSLKTSGDLGLIRDSSLRDMLVLYYEDRQPVLKENNTKAIDAELEWRRALAPYVEISASDAVRYYPRIEVTDVTRLLNDPYFRHNSVLVGGLFSFQVTNAQRMLVLGDSLQTAIRRSLGEHPRTD